MHLYESNWISDAVHDVQMGNRGNEAAAVADIQVAVVAVAEAVDDGDGSQGNDVPEAEPDEGEWGVVLRNLHQGVHLCAGAV